MEKRIHLDINDLSCPPQFQEQYINDICEKENVKVVHMRRYKETLPCFPYLNCGTIVLLVGEI